MKKIKNLENHLGYWLRFVSNHVSASFANRLAEFEIAIGEWVVLSILHEHKSLSSAEIADIVGITRGATSKLLDKLLCKCLINRVDSLNDRRYQEITISTEGKKLLPMLIQEAEMNEQQFFGHLPKEQKVLLTKLLKNMISIKKWNKIPIN